MPAPLAFAMSRRSLRKRDRSATGFLARCRPFHGIPSHYPLRTRVRMKLKFSKLGTAWEIFQTLFALLVSITYVIQTYMPDGRVPPFDFVAIVVFAADYLLNLYCCENRWHFIISVNGVMDALTIFPALMDQFSGHSKSLPFIRFVRVMRLLRLIRVVRVAGSQTVSAVQKQVYTIILFTTCLVFVAAGIFHAVESNDGAQPDLQFGEALYYIVVTISTVGYGDIVPVTSGGRAVALGVIIVSFTVIPAEISHLTHLMDLQSHFRTTYHPSVGKPHVLVVGHVMEPRSLLNFFREFYHPDRALLGTMTTFAGPAGTHHEIDPSVVELPCVIVGPKEPTEEIINLLDHPVLQNRVTYIKASVMSEEDMCRVGADAARACFVLASKAAPNTKQADAETVMRLLAIRNYNPDLPVYTQIVSPVYLDYISGVDADQVLCLDQIKISLLAKSCLCPGLVTLISNLFRSSTLVNRQILSSWEQEYAEGMALEVYATTLPSVFHGLTFSQACELLYNISDGEVILLAVYGEPSVSSSNSTNLADLKAMPQLRRCSWTHQVEHPAQMLSNPGSSVIMRHGQLVYLMSESKKLTHTTSITNELKAWLAKGNVLPTRGARPNLMSKRSPPKHVIQRSAGQQGSAEPTESRLVEEMFIEEATYPSTDKSIRNHIIVVTDLEVTSTVAFAQMLRLERHVPGSSDYHPIIFLSWSSVRKATTTCRELRQFDDIFVMLATGDSKRELLRANILDASRCVVLADKANIQDVDGEAVDSQTIFHYLAVLSIQAEYGMDTTSGLMPMVELNMPRTMQILDATLKKRTATSFQQRQVLDSLVLATTPISTAAVTSSEFLRVSEQRVPEDLSDVKRMLGKANVVKNIYLRGADNISTLDQQVKLSKRINTKRTLIKREIESTRHHYFDVRRSALLPFFAAGYGFVDDIFDTMLCQSFFTPGIIRLIYELLFSENGHPAALSGDNRARSSFTASSLVQIPVPTKFVRRTFGELFLHLLSTKEIVSIGLYRGTDTPFQLPYVATGPARDTILVEDDLVFILAHPDALENGSPSRTRQQDKTNPLQGASSHNYFKLYEEKHATASSAVDKPSKASLPPLVINSKASVFQGNFN